MVKKRSIWCLAMASVAVGSTLCFVASSVSAADDNLACQITSKGAVAHAFSYRLEHMKFLQTAISPTAPAPENHTVNGGDQSQCDVLAWAGKLEKLKFRQVKPPKYRVPKGVAWLTVETLVPDEGPEGENWDADEQQFTELKARDLDIESIGGDGIEVPTLDDRAWGFWIGAENRHAVGIWRDQDLGFITIEVSAHRIAQDSLREAARKIVPRFNP